MTSYDRENRKRKIEIEVNPEELEDEDDEEEGIATQFGKFVKKKLGTSKKKFAEVD